MSENLNLYEKLGAIQADLRSIKREQEELRAEVKDMRSVANKGLGVFMALAALGALWAWGLDFIAAMLKARSP